MASAKNGVRNRVRIDDAGSILKFRIGFRFGENSACFCQSVWLPGSILNFRYRVRIVDRGVDCRDPVCRHRFRFLEIMDRQNTTSESVSTGVWFVPGFGAGFQIASSPEKLHK